MEWKICALKLLLMTLIKYVSSDTNLTIKGTTPPILIESTTHIEPHISNSAMDKKTIPVTSKIIEKQTSLSSFSHFLSTIKSISKSPTALPSTKIWEPNMTTINSHPVTKSRSLISTTSSTTHVWLYMSS